MKRAIIYVAAFLIGLACGSCQPVNNRSGETLHERELRLYRLNNPDGRESYVFIIRKLHLVRPDLLPYPIDYPVYA